MSMTHNILRSYMRPHHVLAQLLQDGKREDRALAILFTACGALFLMQIPLRFEGAAAGGDMVRDLSYAFFTSMMLLPLILYALAAFVHLLARLLGGKGSWYSARLAVFWSLLAICPLALIWAVVKGFYGDTLITSLLSWGGVGLFLWIFGGAIWQAQRA